MQPTTMLGLAGIGAFLAYARDWLCRVWLYASAFVIRREYILVNYWVYLELSREVNKLYPPLYRPIRYSVLQTQADRRHNFPTDQQLTLMETSPLLQPVLLQLKPHTNVSTLAFAKEAAEASGSLFGLPELRRVGWKPFWLKLAAFINESETAIADLPAGTHLAKIELISFRFFDPIPVMKQRLKELVQRLAVEQFVESNEVCHSDIRLPFGLRRGQHYQFLTHYGSDPHSSTTAKVVNESPSSNPPSTANDGTDVFGRFGLNNIRHLQFSKDFDVVLGELAPPENPTREPAPNLWLQPELQVLWDDIDQWLDSYDDYREIGLSHRYGCLLHGRPGTGKTSFVIAVAKHHQIPIYSLQLANLTESDIQYLLAVLPRTGAAILLIEDIDTVFHGNVRREDARTSGFKNLIGLDVIRQLMDNNVIPCSTICVITTNHLELVDETLYRAGRCDRVIEVKPLTEDGIRAVVRKRLARYPELIEDVTTVALVRQRPDI